MARDSQFAKMKRKLKFKIRQPQPLPDLRPRRAAFCASSKCAASVSAATRSREKFPAS